MLTSINEDQSHYKKQLKSVLVLVTICCPSRGQVWSSLGIRCQRTCTRNRIFPATECFSLWTHKQRAMGPRHDDCYVLFTESKRHILEKRVLYLDYQVPILPEKHCAINLVLIYLSRILLNKAKLLVSHENTSEDEINLIKRPLFAESGTMGDRNNEEVRSVSPPFAVRYHTRRQERSAQSISRVFGLGGGRKYGA